MKLESSAWMDCVAYTEAALQLKGYIDNDLRWTID